VEALTSAVRAELFFIVHVRPRFRPGTQCDDRMLDLRDYLYCATLALHYDDVATADWLICRAADAAFLLHDFEQEHDLLAYTNQLRTEAQHDR
jgi:hypothetical protein